MDNIFDIYSAKVDNDEVTESDANLLLSDCYASTNPIEYRLCYKLKVGYSKQPLIITFR